MKINEVKNLIFTYGADITLGELLERVQGIRTHKCPKCDGKGKLQHKYNAYPSGLPDSGWVEEWKYKTVDCDLCNGEGYTVKEYVPKMIQDGWEVK